MIGAGSYLRRLDASKKGSSLVRLTIRASTEKVEA